MLNGRTCSGKNDRDEACGATPLRSSEFCVFHDPEHAEAMQEARRLGGFRRRREGTVSAAYEFDGLATPADIRRLVEVAAFDVLGLENSIARARTLAYLAQVASSLVEKHEMEARLEVLEAEAARRPAWR